MLNFFYETWFQKIFLFTLFVKWEWLEIEIEKWKWNKNDSRSRLENRDSRRSLHRHHHHHHLHHRHHHHHIITIWWISCRTEFWGHSLFRCSAAVLEELGASANGAVLLVRLGWVGRIHRYTELGGYTMLGDTLPVLLPTRDGLSLALQPTCLSTD